jgi:hypothetical protein
MAGSVDALIASGIRPPEVQTPTQAYGQALTLGNAMQERQLNQQQIQAATLENQQRRQLLNDQQRISAVLASPDVAGDIEKALPRLASAGVSGQSILALTKAHVENQEHVATTRKAFADAAEAQQKATDAQMGLVGNALLHVKDQNYDPATFAATLNQLEYANPAMKPQLDHYRQQLSAAPDPGAAVQQITDNALATSGVGERALTARAERANKEAATEKDQAATQKDQADLPRVRADAEIAQNKLRMIQNAKPDDYMALVDQIAPPSVKENSALNQRTKSQVQFYLSKGNLEGAQTVLTNAANEVRQLEVATDPRVQANKVNLTIANADARANANITNSGMTPDDFKSAGEQYARTGVMPPMGRDTATRGRIMHEAQAWARDNGLGPSDLVSMQAAYSGDKESLKKFQTQRDQIVSFENTASKNLDQFLQAASKIPDTGVPWLNTPVRMLDEKLVGSANMAAVNAARQIANNEIAKVTSGGGLSGVLSDSARHEISGFNPANATLPQILAVAKVLKQDMANRHGSMDAMLGDIKGRISGTPGVAAYKQTPDQPGTGSGSNPAGGSVKVTDPRGVVHEFKSQADADKFRKLAGIQ